MYTLKSIARRATLLGAAFALAVSTVTPFAPAAFADALNPLTDRSLTLSSSSPGWDFLDGSGNALYAPPNSGANGQKTGNTFDFKVSTDSSATGTNEPVKAMTFQYCRTSAGNCVAPGDNGCVTGTYLGEDCSARKTNAQALTANDKTSDLEIVSSTPTEIDNADFGSIIDLDDSDGGIEGTAKRLPLRNDSEGSYIVYYLDPTSGDWTQSEDWALTVDNEEIYNGGAGVTTEDTATGLNNYITLTNATGQGLESGTRVKVVFFATDDNYITNPGSGAFFVKINTYKDDTTLTEANLIDGGVTVANVMNQSINIQTKVLETMDFSVGVVDPFTLDSTDTDGVTPGVQSQLKTANGQDSHGQCSRILKGMELANDDEPKNTLLMGDPDAEFSLRTDKTYSTHSYWRLSSNSSAGATVYYSGNTLANTVNDTITPIGTTAAAPSRGSEQFGLALANGTLADNPQPATPLTNTNVHLVNYGRERGVGQVYENGADNDAGAGVHASVATDITTQNLTNVYHTPRLWPLLPMAAYDDGGGNVNTEYGGVDTKFAFDNNSTYIPAALATQDDQVVDCVTGKMRYIANIAATTPAGIYTTKINYIAAPQY